MVFDKKTFPLVNWFMSNKRRARVAQWIAIDKGDQLLAYGRWFFPGTPASSTTKTDPHDIADILLKMALKHQKINQINQ